MSHISDSSHITNSVSAPMKRCVYFHLTPNDKRVFYIGVGVKNRPYNFNDRNHLWKKIVEINGKPIVVIVAENLSKNEASELEIFWINFYGLENLANISPGGNLQKDESINKIRKSNIGKKRSEETKKLMSNARIGKPAWNKGIEHTDETKLKMKMAKTGFKHSIKTKQKMSDNRKGKAFNLNSYMFVHDEFGIKFCTMLELRNEFGLSSSGLSRMMKGKRQSYGGWKIVK